MKKAILIISALFVGAIGVAQNKNAKATIEVDGVCKMCKERIERASVQAKGVKYANWNVETHQLKLIYNEGRTDLKTIQQSIAESGHDTQDVKAKDSNYESIDECCKYRDPQVHQDHKEGGH